ncbi:DUF2087 domain-containing protein [Alkalicoccus luteus]|uniref:DUF2087 domain-containing protein n=1 Tax=Alkalicoccus luteus TaxID=1237094 RepID=A0A969PQY1_9BACI|nr:DUF2087 domain-containing protein [Alkalicoccus luteus]NJP37738.1 DUF2087 domain-containing protein [Alkalicoccus luteus]
MSYMDEASIDEITQGWLTRNGINSCLFCGFQTENGVVYQHQGLLFEAAKRMSVHITEAHQSAAAALLAMDRRYTGLTQVQQEVLVHLQASSTDKQTAAKMGIAEATVRSHRFKLKEKEKQAKLFLALMAQKPEREKLVPYHEGAVMRDERYAVTEAEAEKILDTYLKEGREGPLSSFPRKEKRKLVLLRHLAEQFEPQRTYEEKEINEHLKQKYDDFVTLRRYLIEYGFLDRSRDGSSYWVKHTRPAPQDF